MSSILVVEDEQQVRSLMKERLELGGYPDINVVGSGKEAVRFCQDRAMDLVITDLVMPDMDGLHISLLDARGFPLGCPPCPSRIGGCSVFSWPTAGWHLKLRKSPSC